MYKFLGKEGDRARREGDKRVRKDIENGEAMIVWEAQEEETINSFLGEMRGVGGKYT